MATRKSPVGGALKSSLEERRTAVITIGVDAHKSLLVAAAVDGAGRRTGGWRGANSPQSWGEMLMWADGLGGQRRWGIEGAWGYGRGLAQPLVKRGERVFEVNPRLTAQGRRRARKMDKSDRLDAEAVARAVLREEELPAVAAEDQTATLDLLSREREAAVAEAARLRNRAHALLFSIDPQYREKLPPLASAAGLEAMLSYRADGDAAMQVRAGLLRNVAERIKLALEQAAEVTRAIRSLVKEALQPLTAICGIGTTAAGAIAGILGPGRRFATDAQLASYAGAAPLEASSSGALRHRLNRNGDRRLNAVLHRTVLTQSRVHGPAQEYLGRRMAEGKSRTEAVRALKRYIARAILNAWRRCQTQNIDISKIAPVFH